MNKKVHDRAKKLIINNVRNSYKEDDCIFLIKDISNKVQEITVEEKEELVNKGISYSETLTKEELPSKEYLDIFLDELECKKTMIAKYIANLSELILRDRGENVILVSLARGGTPAGILVKRYLKFKYNIDVPHYSISVIRGRGLDFNALSYIIDFHKNDNLLFIDGWTGKGSITFEIEKSIKLYNELYHTNIKDELAVILDPAELSTFYGTREDILLPNACLNSTVSGLISRTVDKKELIGEDSFHGAKYYKEYEKYDVSNLFIDTISNEFSKIELEELITLEGKTNIAEETLNYIMDKHRIADINKIKLSVGETSRVLLRRKAKLIIVKNLNSNEVRHIKLLAEEKGVSVIQDKNIKYNAIGIIE